MIRIIFTGYSYLQNIDNATCLELCRQDEKCTAMVHSELLPPSRSSVCKFYNTEKATITLVEAASSDPSTKTQLVILESTGNARFVNSTLEGEPFSTFPGIEDLCKLGCKNTTFFCDAISYHASFLVLVGTCRLYSLEDITGIAFSDGSVVKL